MITPEQKTEETSQAVEMRPEELIVKECWTHQDNKGDWGVDEIQNYRQIVSEIRKAIAKGDTASKADRV